MNTVGMKIFFEFIRLSALYATASAVITTIGREALKKIRLLLIRRGRINIIYGINDDTLALGRDLAQNKQGIIVFVDEKASAAETISSFGGLIKTDSHALKADLKFLKSIGFRVGHRTLSVFAVSKNMTANIRYSKKLLASLDEIKAPPECLHLVILEQEDSAVSQLQCTDDRYGYGFVNAVSEPQMAARLLMMKFPPCNTLSFDKDGRATEDLDVLVIGFGQVGQAVLKALVMNGQFEGSTFCASVFANDCNSTDGRFADQLSPMLKNYDINLYQYDARSRKMYEYLSEHCNTLKYVVVCTGKDDINHEIADDMINYFNRHDRNVPVFICSRKGVETCISDRSETATYKIYQADLLCGDRFDKMAMVINHSYQSSKDKTPLQNWLKCDYFSRQSCRAFADFVPAVLRSVSPTADKVDDGEWSLTEAQKDVLSKTEHLRWCAFHYCMGFDTMTDEEFEARSDAYKKQVALEGSSDIRIAKNMKNRTHACLVSWEELKTLSEKEAAVTGIYRDYQAMDTDNIMSIPDILRAAKQ